MISGFFILRRKFMNDINMANRQCCDLDIRDYKTKAPWMDAKFCNTTTMGFSSDPVFAMKKGAKAIKFDNPLDGTIALTFQMAPFRLYAMLSDGEVETSAVIARKETVKATAAGTLTLSNVPVSGTVFVYAEDDWGGTAIKGTASEKTFTATTEGDIALNTSYVVGYLEAKADGVKRIVFNNARVPKDFYIQMSTLDKNESGEIVPVRMTAYKASPQRNLDLSFSSEGDPAEITITCDCLEDENGDVLDMIEITDEIA